MSGGVSVCGALYIESPDGYLYWDEEDKLIEYLEGNVQFEYIPNCLPRSCDSGTSTQWQDLSVPASSRAQLRFLN